MTRAAMPAVRESDRMPQEVRSLFDRVARRYDLTNTLLSVGLDGRWRRAAAGELRMAPAGRALDVACGSGSLTRALAGRGGEVVGLDFSEGMLGVARRRGVPAGLVRGDALRLPFAPATFSGVTMAFGLRNLVDPEGGLREMLRVLRPGGRAVVLEFLRPPRGPVGAAYGLYLARCLPVLGGLLTGEGPAYRYLAETVGSYRTLDQLAAMAGSAGWRQPRARALTFGTVGVVSGTAG